MRGGAGLGRHTFVDMSHQIGLLSKASSRQTMALIYGEERSAAIRTSAAQQHALLSSSCLR